MQHAFTVDVEDYFQVSAFEHLIDRHDWSGWESRVVANTWKLLRLLERNSVRATFFVLGWTAERHPELVTAIDRAGHEIGSHSYWHRLVYEMEPHEFRADLRRSIDVLRQITGKPVTTFRAPSFSITGASQWALPILVEEGIEIDSSVFPVVHDRYGIPNAPLEIYRQATTAGDLWEFPLSVLQWGGWHLPAAGGGYFRLYPNWFFRRCARNIAQQRPYVFYVHPWELDDAQPRLSGISPATRFRHYIGLRRTEARLERLLGDLNFGTISEVVHQQRQQTTATFPAAVGSC